MKIAILGCGPAGLMAAHAASLQDHSVEILSKKEPSQIHGAQFLHKPIPGLHDPGVPDGLITFHKIGTKEGYAEKVYGDPKADCSWDAYEDGHEQPAWRMVETYERLWEMFEDQISEVTITPYTLDVEVAPNYDLVISSIPAYAICHQKGVHRFESAEVYFQDGFNMIHGSPQRLIDAGNVIAYNGTRMNFYRFSRLFGHAWYEFGASKKLHSPDRQGFKPLRTDCDCFPEVRRIGRFGTWTKGVLVHDAFFGTLKAMEVYA